MAIQPAFTLNANEIFSTLANMYISQQVFADNLGKHQTLVDKARVDGSMYGDKKLYYSTDVLESHEWTGDLEASNLLGLDRPKDPEVQSITLDVFRQIRLTIDNYLTKRGFSTEGAFGDFNSVMLSWIRDTKKVYDGTLYNTFIGTDETSVGKQQKTITINAGGNSTGENIARDMADLFTDMGDYTTDYNDYGHLRSYSEDQIKVVWNAKYVNAVKKIDLPSIFHDEALQSTFVGDVLPQKYFGIPLTAANISTYSASTPTTGKPINSGTGAYTPGTNHANGCVRAVYEASVTVGGNPYHVFPGQEIPAGATVKAGGDFELGTVYIEDATIICKVLVKLPPIMSAFESGTVFFNPRSLTENHYLTWGHNTLAHLKNYPMITIRAVEAE